MDFAFAPNPEKLFLNFEITKQYKNGLNKHHPMAQRRIDALNSR
jgi:hypothetical protein